MDHVVLVLFENRSFDNLLGRLYAPGEVESFEGVVGKDLSNPVPDWAEHGAAGGVVPYGISVGMDAPDPDPGEEYPHTNTQLFNVLDDANRFKDANEMVAPYNAPPDGRQPTMDGFVTDYISFLTVELGRQPTYEEYSQIMTGYTPEQVPVISTLARGFGVFDHWFSEVPSQTLANRSFWTAATSSGFVVNRPVTNFMRHHMAETIFDRLERCGKTWKVYVLEPGTPLLYRLHPYAAPARPLRHPFPSLRRVRAGRRRGHPARFLADRAQPHGGPRGLPPRIRAGHDPGRRRPHGRTVVDLRRGGLPRPDLPGGAVRGLDDGVQCLQHVALRRFRRARGAPTTTSRRDLWRPRTRAPAPGQLGFAFDRSGYRVPAVIVSPWVPSGTVCTDEYRHTSMLATLREAWNLGEPFTARDAAAPSFEKVLSLEAPRPPETWPDVDPLPVPLFQAENVQAMRALGTLGRHLCHGLYEHARHDKDLPDPPDSDPKVSPALAIDFAEHLGSRLFPRLARSLPAP